MTAITNPTTFDRLLSAFRTLVRQEDPLRKYRGILEYVVQATDGNTIDALPSDPTQNLPGITKIPMRAGIAGGRCKPAKGTKVYLAFANADPTIPIIICYDYASSQGISFDSGLGTAEHVTSIEAIAGILSQLAGAINGQHVDDTAINLAMEATVTASLSSTLKVAIAQYLALKGTPGAVGQNIGFPNTTGA